MLHPRILTHQRYSHISTKHAIPCLDYLFSQTSIPLTLVTEFLGLPEVKSNKIKINRAKSYNMKCPQREWKIHCTKFSSSVSIVTFRTFKIFQSSFVPSPEHKSKSNSTWNMNSAGVRSKRTFLHSRPVWCSVEGSPSTSAGVIRAAGLHLPLTATAFANSFNCSNYTFTRSSWLCATQHTHPFKI